MTPAITATDLIASAVCLSEAAPFHVGSGRDGAKPARASPVAISISSTSPLVKLSIRPALSASADSTSARSIQQIQPKPGRSAWRRPMESSS